MARASVITEPGYAGKTFSVHIEQQFDITAEASAIRKAVTSVAEQVAEKWVEGNRDKIMERLNIDAIANMIMLEVAKEIKSEIVNKDK
jgi:hypothetical protein